MVALSQNEILAPDDLPGYLKGMDIIIYNKDSSDIPSLEEVEKKYIYWVLEQCNFNKTKAAKLIGIDRVSLWRKLKKYNLEY
jgi:DNA-binding protein Fis